MWEESFCWSHGDTLLRLFWGAPEFQGRYHELLFNFCFSLSLAFSIVDSLLLVQVKHRVFGFLRVFITRIKGYARVKVADKDSKHNN